MLTPHDALERLKEGNRRFVSNLTTRAPIQTLPMDLPEEQAPFAIVLGCSDSRVPAEIVFDQGLGDLFVIRVAGNIVAPSQIGSVEFAADRFGTRLVIVLGHSRCGAILATLDELRLPTTNQSPNLRSIVERVRPAVEGLLENQAQDSDLVEMAVQANIRSSVKDLSKGSELIQNLVKQGQLLIVGAEYSLESGEVTFFDDATNQSSASRQAMQLLQAQRPPPSVCC
jgi:carbonic anhydrase